MKTCASVQRGHPLSLAYLVKRLAAAPDPTAAAEVLDKSRDFGGDTDAEYAAYWDKLRSDTEVRELLALVSRIRGSVELATIKKLVEESVVERFAANAFYLFRQLTPERWAFFHNSFRQFCFEEPGSMLSATPIRRELRPCINAWRQ